MAAPASIVVTAAIAVATVVTGARAARVVNSKE
jgi:hypothetical protein